MKHHSLKYTVCLGLMFITLTACALKKTKHKTESKAIANEQISDTAIATSIVQLPSYPGGKEAMHAFIQKTKKYPKDFGSLGVEGKVLISFLVEQDGTLSDIKVLKSVHPSLDEAALNVVKVMPKWVPGKEKGKPQKMKMQVPIDFYFLK